MITASGGQISSGALSRRVLIALLAVLCGLSIVMQDRFLLRAGGFGIPVHRAVFAGAVVMSLTRRRRPDSLPFLAVALGWLVICAAVLVLHPARPQSIATFLNYGLDGALVGILLYTEAGTRFLRRVLGVVFWLTVLSAAIGVLEVLLGRYVVPDILVPFRTRERFGRIRGQGVFPHPLVLGVACAVCVVTAREILQSRRTARYCRLILVVGMIATQSRGPLLMLASAVAIFYAAGLSRRARWLWPLLALVAVLATLSSRDTTEISQRSSDTAVSSAYRTVIVKAGIDVVRHHPIGLGFGSLEPRPELHDLIRPFGGAQVNIGRSVDNDFALIGIYGGFVLEMAYLAMLTWAARAIVQRGATRGTRTAVAALGSVAVGACFVALFSFLVLSFLSWLAIAGALTTRPPNWRATSGRGARHLGASPFPLGELS